MTYYSQTMLIAELSSMGITDSNVLNAITQVPRDHFMSAALANRAYENTALPIACEQTISQPFIVALMTQAVMTAKPNKVLEIGTGSGYQAAILSLLVEQVVSIERIKTLYETAKEYLAKQGYDNIICHYGDGFKGYPQGAPYDGILVTAASEKIPDALCQQLAEGGKLIIPVGGYGSQRLLEITREGENFHQKLLDHVIFVPLLPGTSTD